jgi:signal transduction histidine kinase
LKFKSLKYRVLFWFISLVSILLLIFSFLFYYFLEESINLKIQTNLYQETLKIQNQLVKNKNINLNNLDFEIAIIKTNKIIHKTSRFTLKDYKKYIKKEQIFFLKEIDEYNVNAIYVLNINKPFKGYIVVYKKGISNKAEDVEDILLVLNPILLIILFLIGNRLIDKILAPIKRITNSAKKIQIDNFTHTINLPQKDDEIKELVEAFNNMIKRLQDGVTQLDRFNSDLSHELKTPLTTIQGELELCLTKSRDKQYYKNNISNALNQTYEIKKLIDELLLLTKYSKQNIKDTFTLCYLDTILMNICDKYEHQLKKQNITLTIQKFEHIKISANLLLFNSIFSNLLDNAIKYSNKNTTITISLFQQNKQIYFIIQDEGIGIPPNKLPQVTNRFYRVDESRNKKIKGFGLGLSIIKNSIELHNGKLNIKSILNQGTTITIIL